MPKKKPKARLRRTPSSHDRALRRAEMRAMELIAWAESPEFSLDFPKIRGEELARNVARIISAYYSREDNQAVF